LFVLFFFFDGFDLIDLFICFCFFLEELRLACGGTVDGVKGKEDLKKVKEILSQHHSLLNEDLEAAGWTPLKFASYINCVSIVEFLVSFDDIEVNKVDQV
jgi:hypothetical protein